MRASILSGVICAFLVGCSSSVQVGLANAPLLANGGTPETRVHDVIANGNDSCERSGFPPGEVLKGHIPPCVKKEKLAAVPDVPWTPAPSAGFSARYMLGICPSEEPGLIGTARGMAAAPVSSSSRELVCIQPW
jgi:hypothetical protein